MVQGTLREVEAEATALVRRFEQAATDEFKAMLADKVRQLTEGGVTEALAIVEVRKLWLEALR